MDSVLFLPLRRYKFDASQTLDGAPRGSALVVCDCAAAGAELAHRRRISRRWRHKWRPLEGYGQRQGRRGAQAESAASFCHRPIAQRAAGTAMGWQ